MAATAAPRFLCAATLPRFTARSSPPGANAKAEGVRGGGRGGGDLVGNHHAYIGTKAGIDHVVRGVADEYGAKGIRVNSISPGLTASPMAAPHLETPGLLDAFLKNYPLGRLNTSEDIAAAAVFLGSDECYMTGQNLQVNGGLTLRRNPLPSEIEESVMAAMAATQAE